MIAAMFVVLLATMVVLLGLLIAGDAMDREDNLLAWPVLVACAVVILLALFFAVPA